MYKKCKEILEELESQGKLKIWKDFEFPQPVPLKKRLKDVLEKNVDEKYYLSDDKVANFMKTFKKLPEDKTPCDRLGNCSKDIDSQCGQVYSTKGTSPTITAGTHGYAIGHILEEPVIGASRGRNPENPSDRTTGSPTEQRLEINTNGTSNCLTTVAKDNYVVEPKIQKVEGNLYPNSGDPQAGRVYKSDGISPALDTCSGGNRMPKIIENQPNIRIRRLTPRECWRLQAFRDEDFDKIYNYKFTKYLIGSEDKKCNAKLKAVTEKPLHTGMDTYVCCTTKDISDMEMQLLTKMKNCMNEKFKESQQNVNIAIELLEELEPLECATSITKCIDYMVTLSMQTEKKEVPAMVIIELEKEVKQNIGRYMKITLEENSHPMKWYTILTLIEQIIGLKIYTCIRQKANIRGNIAITENFSKSLKMVKLSNLRMEYTTNLVSSSQLYKQAGNSICVSVLMALFFNLFRNSIGKVK